MTDEHPPGLVCVPTMDWMYTRPAISLQEVSHNLPEGSAWQWEPGNSKPIAAKRNDAVRAAVKSGAAWLLFLDSDMIFPEDVVPRLLSVDADVSCGLYTLKAPEADYTAVAGHVENLPAGAPEKRPTDHPDFRHRTLDLRKVGEEMGVVEVDCAGTGCMLIHRRVFNELRGPWFCANDRHRTGFNEDYNFTIRARRAGLSVKVDTRLQCRHVGAHGIGVAEARGHWSEKVRRREAAG